MAKTVTKKRAGKTKPSSKKKSATHLSIPDALYWSFERSIHPSSLESELVSATDADRVIASAATAICWRNGEHETPVQYARLVRQVREMLPKVHAAWLKMRHGRVMDV